MPTSERNMKMTCKNIFRSIFRESEENRLQRMMEHEMDLKIKAEETGGAEASAKNIVLGSYRSPRKTHAPSSFSCMSRYIIAFAALMALAIIFPLPAGAHALGTDLSKLSRTDVALAYLKLGYTHIIPLGLDHILFVLCIFLLNAKLKPVIWQATAFTVAHSITLGLAMYGVITPPTNIVEPVIALSIMYVALENMLTDKLKPSRILIVFVFGLIHGMGFASALTGLGLPEKEFATALITFNVGVELGQLSIILGAWFLVGKWFAQKNWYHQRIVNPASLLIAIVACYWTIERTFFAA
ncbi:MAG TPA: HupE/UreJ family protein [Bacteroidia bacterium]